MPRKVQICSISRAAYEIEGDEEEEEKEEKEILFLLQSQSKSFALIRFTHSQKLKVKLHAGTQPCKIVHPLIKAVPTA